MRIKVKLTNKEVELARSLAVARDEKKVRFGAGRYAECSKKTGSSENSHFYGLLGEIAVAKHFKVEIDKRIFATHGDDGVDLVLEDPDLGNVQVKTTTYTKDPFLRVPMGKQKDKDKLKDIDSYICCCIDVKNSKEVQIVGWIDHKELVKKKTRRFLRYGPVNYVAKESELNGF